MKRLLTAAVLIPIALLAVFRLPAVALFWTLGVLVVIPASFELADMIRVRVPSFGRFVLLAGTVVVAIAVAPASAGLPQVGASYTPLALGVVALSTAALRPRVPIEEGWMFLGAAVYGSLYLGIGWAAFGILAQHGAEWVFLVLAVVWLCDSGAYYAGRNLGRRKLAPAVSPNKTWEGAIGGTLVALLGGAGWSLWQLGAVEPVLMGWVLAVAIAGQLGDLVESKVKRGVGVKDSGRLLPGHGGMLDRIDALLLAAPVLAVGLDRFGLRALGS